MCAVLIALSAMFGLAGTADDGLAGDKSRTMKRDGICDIIEREAKKQKLPVAFFTRLIWKESQFNSRAVSHKGALGIAQFMPDTAQRWGLKNPFDPRKALPASARYLAFLKNEFGNLGLAAAAYNAGRLRVWQWRDGKVQLPEETLDYVFSITGWPASYWKNEPMPLLDPPDADGHPQPTQCRSWPIALFSDEERKQIGDWRPWGAQLAASFSRTRALQIYQRLRDKYHRILHDKKPMLILTRNLSMGRKPIFAVRIGDEIRAEVLSFCEAYRRAGGVCVVVHS